MGLERAAGKKVQCPHCGRQIVIPSERSFAVNAKRLKVSGESIFACETKADAKVLPVDVLFARRKPALLFINFTGAMIVAVFRSHVSDVQVVSIWWELCQKRNYQASSKSKSGSAKYAMQRKRGLPGTSGLEKSIPLTAQRPTEEKTSLRQNTKTFTKKGSSFAFTAQSKMRNERRSFYVFLAFILLISLAIGVWACWQFIVEGFDPSEGLPLIAAVLSLIGLLVFLFAGLITRCPNPSWSGPTIWRKWPSNTKGRKPWRNMEFLRGLKVLDGRHVLKGHLGLTVRLNDKTDAKGEVGLS